MKAPERILADRRYSEFTPFGNYNIAGCPLIRPVCVEGLYIGDDCRPLDRGHDRLLLSEDLYVVPVPQRARG
jgi:hypothetical protein